MDVDMKSTDHDTPLYCDMSVFTPAAREAHVLSTDRLFQTVQAVNPTAGGFEFVFPNPGGSEHIGRFTEFVSNERLCCPFLEFTLKIPPTGAPITLLLSGPDGTQAFLRAEFSGVFS
jgi:hypothetical protein